MSEKELIDFPFVQTNLIAQLQQKLQNAIMTGDHAAIACYSQALTTALLGWAALANALKE